MVTCADLIEETRRPLLSGQRESMNTLMDAVDASVTSFGFDHDLGPLVAGAYLSIDLEIMYVWSINQTAKTAEVQRGMLGSVAAAHVDNSLVYVNSKFPTFALFQALNQDLDDLSSPGNGLFRIVSTEIDYNPAIEGYDLAVGVGSDVLNVLAVHSQQAGPSKDWYPLTSYRVNQSANTTDFASGYSITLNEAGEPGFPFRVTYSAPFTKFSALTDNVTVTGLPTSAYDLPPLGAGLRLTGVREISRNFFDSQGGTRRASEVNTNAQLAGYQALVRERSRRIRAEAQKLRSSWPMKRR